MKNGWKRLALVMVLLFMLSVAACTPSDSGETDTPTEERLWIAPWSDQVEMIYETGGKYADTGEQHYLYTGESNVIDMPEFDFTLTIPEAWMDRVEVVFRRVGGSGDGVQSVTQIWIANKALAEAYGDLIDNPEMAYTVDPILRIVWADADKIDMDEYQSMFDSGNMLNGGTQNGSLYWIFAMQMGVPDEDESRLFRGDLIAQIGQDAYDELVGDLFCTPEQAMEIFKLRDA